MSVHGWSWCQDHEECRKVRGTGRGLEMVDCPWCGRRVSTSNIGQWCANCYVMFRPARTWIHFGKHIKKTESECWARALSKSGGTRIGTTTEDPR